MVACGFDSPCSWWDAFLGIARRLAGRHLVCRTGMKGDFCHIEHSVENGYNMSACVHNVGNFGTGLGLGACEALQP